MANTITAMGWRELTRHRNFRAAAERNAAWICALHDPLEPRVRWLFNDSGRAPIITRIFFRLTLTGRATASDLIAAARRRGTPSAGRVLQVIERAQAAGLLAVEANAGKPKRQQRLFVLPELDGLPGRLLRSSRILARLQALDGKQARQAQGAGLAGDLHRRPQSGRSSG